MILKSGDGTINTRLQRLLNCVNVLPIVRHTQVLFRFQHVEWDRLYSSLILRSAFLWEWRHSKMAELSSSLSGPSQPSKRSTKEQHSSEKHEMRWWGNSEARGGPRRQTAHFLCLLSWRCKGFQRDFIKKSYQNLLISGSITLRQLSQRSSNLESHKRSLCVSNTQNVFAGSLSPGVVLQNQNFRACKDSMCFSATLQLLDHCVYGQGEAPKEK